MENGSVHVRVIELKEKLQVEPISQIYLAPADFDVQVKLAREGFLLAVGLRASEWPLFLQVRGYQILVACPLQSEENVSIYRPKNESIEKQREG